MFTAIKFFTEGTPNSVGFTRESRGISSFALLLANITLAGCGDL
jgi:hypothetical protein